MFPTMRGERNMKRALAVILCAVMIVTALAVSPLTASAAKAPVLSPDALLGQSIGSFTNVYKGYTRTDASEYGFTWYIYNKDYKTFLMLGVEGDTIVAYYSNSPTVLKTNSVNSAQTRDQVRAAYGEPIQYRTLGTTVVMLNDVDVTDVYDRDGYTTTVYFDKYNKMKVDGVLKVPTAYEQKVAGVNMELNDALLTAYTRQSFDLVNAARAVRRVATVKWDGQLAGLAAFRSTDMRDRDYFDHYSPEGTSPAGYASQMGIKYKKLGENISCGHKNAIAAHEGFMNSKGHRDNLLNKAYNKLGNATVYGGSKYVYLTNNFKK
jgi:uncharacterized protein YkwD